MSTFVCEACLTVVRNSYDQIEKRVEYRRVAGQARHRVITIARLCRSCADEEVERYRPTKASTDQGRLL